MSSFNVPSHNYRHVSTSIMTLCDSNKIKTNCIKLNAHKYLIIHCKFFVLLRFLCYNAHCNPYLRVISFANFAHLQFPAFREVYSEKRRKFSSHTFGVILRGANGTSCERRMRWRRVPSTKQPKPAPNWMQSMRGLAESD